jgi:hypothetical protein
MTNIKIEKLGKGFREHRDALLGLCKIHSINASKTQFKKENIQKEVAITPANNRQGEKKLNLRFKDSDKLTDAISEFEKKCGTTIYLDFEKDSFIVAVSREMGDMFRNFMKEKGLEEIPETTEIAAIQNARGKSALDKDRSISALKVGNKENPEDLKAWVANPNHSDLENIDTAFEEKISDRVEQK